MAEKEQSNGDLNRKNDSFPTNSSSNAETNASTSNTTLEGFVLDHYEMQRAAGNFEPTDDIDSERTNNFFHRALSESQRMNKEIENSHSKLTKLHAELGANNLDAWRNEHAAEVLTPAEIQCIQLASVQPGQES